MYRADAAAQGQAITEKLMLGAPARSAAAPRRNSALPDTCRDWRTPPAAVRQSLGDPERERVMALAAGARVAPRTFQMARYM